MKPRVLDSLVSRLRVTLPTCAVTHAVASLQALEELGIKTGGAGTDLIDAVPWGAYRSGVHPSVRDTAVGILRKYNRFDAISLLGGSGMENCSLEAAVAIINDLGTGDVRNKQYQTLCCERIARDAAVLDAASALQVLLAYRKLGVANTGHLHPILLAIEKHMDAYTPKELAQAAKSFRNTRNVVELRVKERCLKRVADVVPSLSRDDLVQVTLSVCNPIGYRSHSVVKVLYRRVMRTLEGPQPFDLDMAARLAYHFHLVAFPMPELTAFLIKAMDAGLRADYELRDVSTLALSRIIAACAGEVLPKGVFVAVSQRLGSISAPEFTNLFGSQKAISILLNDLTSTLGHRQLRLSLEHLAIIIDALETAKLTSTTLYELTLKLAVRKVDSIKPTAVLNLARKNNISALFEASPAAIASNLSCHEVSLFLQLLVQRRGEQFCPRFLEALQERARAVIVHASVVELGLITMCLSTLGQPRGIDTSFLLPHVIALAPQMSGGNAAGILRSLSACGSIDMNTQLVLRQRIMTQRELMDARDIIRAVKGMAELQMPDAIELCVFLVENHTLKPAEIVQLLFAVKKIQVYAPKAAVERLMIIVEGMSDGLRGKLTPNEHRHVQQLLLKVGTQDARQHFATA